VTPWWTAASMACVPPWAAGRVGRVSVIVDYNRTSVRMLAPRATSTTMATTVISVLFCTDIPSTTWQVTGCGGKAPAKA